MRVIVITGLSGSGKSTALRALEDIGFFCVDNMPVALLPKFLEVQSDPAKEIDKVAMVMDLREKGFADKYARVFKRIKEKGYSIEILFIDANDEVILHRFSETRRRHPLAPYGSVVEGIRVEREKLAPLKNLADKIIDTSSLNVHQLKDAVQRYFLGDSPGKRLALNITSFGYRYGLPVDADMVIDVRFLNNPHFVEKLRPLDGHDKCVSDYVLKSREGRIFNRKIIGLLEFLLPLYEKEGKLRLNLACGCTGGRHRSVVIANNLARHFTEQGYMVNISHRDIGKS